MEDQQLIELENLAKTLALKAGRLVVEQREEAVATATTKSSPTDPVTEADRASEQAIVAGITAVRPDDAIVGEEGTNRPGTSGYEWLVDPIDGTTNFVYGIPAYSVSIALAERATDGGAPTILCGVVYNPMLDELFEARRGAGARLNGEPINVGQPVELSRALVSTGFGYDADRRRNQAAVVAELLGSIRDIRRVGSAALDLCWVACGRVDAYYEAGLNAWDYAAGSLIAAEAGATCADLEGGPPSSRFLLAATPGLDSALADRLRRLGADKVT